MLTDTLYIAGTKYQRVTVSSPRFIGFRCLHMREGGYPNPEGMPCVRPSYNSRPVSFTKDLQLRSYALNAGNENLTTDKWRKVYGNTTAFTNGSGFDKRDSAGNYIDPRADWVNMRDTTMPPPSLQKGIICGGMFIRGVIEGEYLVCTPGVHAIDANTPVPTVAEIIARQWYFTATTGGWERVSHFPQGGGQPVLIPYILREVTRYKLSGVQSERNYTNFVRWEADELPEPTRFYSPL